MLKKLLLTLLVCGLVYLVIRFRQRRAQVVLDGRPGDGPPVATTHRCRNMGLLLAASMLLAFAAYVLYAWWAIRPVVSVRVINPETGDEAVYLAFEEDVDERGFKTLDGKRVSLGSLEHIETQEVDRR